jgi:hypothetical protein
MPKVVPEGFVFTRVLKYGMARRRRLRTQNAACRAGFGGRSLTNKFFIPARRSGKSKKQTRKTKANGLEGIGGKAGKQTITSLKGIWGA